MKCKNCGKDIEADWNKCAYCGAEIVTQLKDIENSGKEGKKKRFGLKGIIVVVVLIFALFCMGDDGENSDNNVQISENDIIIQAENAQDIEGGMEEIDEDVDVEGHSIDITALENKAWSDMTEDEMIEWVKRGYLSTDYKEFNIITIQDMIEYNWPGGKWSLSESYLNDARVVEYTVEEGAKEINFWVNGSKIIKLFGMWEGEEQVDISLEIDNMYWEYYENHTPTDALDFAEFVDGDFDELVNTGTIEGGDKYYICKGKCCLLELSDFEEDETLYTLEMEDGPFCGMTFAGMRPGDHFDSEALEDRGYTLWEKDISEFEEVYRYRQSDSGASVRFYINWDGCIHTIEWMSESATGMYLMYIGMEDELLYDEDEDVQVFGYDLMNVDYELTYREAIEDVCEKVGEDVDQLRYAFYDINKDGYYELLIENSEHMYEVYTTDGTIYPTYLGTINMYNVELYEEKWTNGMYTDYCQMGYEELTCLTIEDGKLVQTVIFSGQNENYGYDINGEPFAELEYPITVHTLAEGIVWSE